MKDNLSILYKEAAYLVCLVKGQVCRLKTCLYTHNFICDLRKIYALGSKTLDSYEILFQTLKQAGLQSTTKITHLSSNDQWKNNKDNNDVQQSCSHCHLMVLIHDLLKGKKTSHRFLISYIRELTKDDFAVRKLRRAYKLVEKRSQSQITHQGETRGLLPCYARVNFLKTTLSDVVEKLETCGLKQVQYNRSETSYRKFRKKVRKLNRGEFLLDYHFPHMLLVFSSGTALYELELYKSRCILIQDKASCFSTEILQPDPNSDVLDACAAPGNKTSQLISMMSSKSTVFAFDRDPNRFQCLTENLVANGVDRLSVIDWPNSDSKHNKHRKSLQSSQPFVEASCTDFLSVDPYDPKFSNVQSILLDPSCSGSGLSIRQPDGEQQLKNSQLKGDYSTDTYNEEYLSRLKRLSNLQAMLLRHALNFPNVQRIVYSTCSIHPEENEAVVQENANRVSDKFYLETIWPNTIPLNSVDNITATPQVWKHRGLSEYQCESCIRSSQKDLTNGFFVALFVRRKSRKSLNNASSTSISTTTPSARCNHSSTDSAASMVVSHDDKNISSKEQETFTFKIRKKCRTDL
uniref:Putative methyltransferase NSUN5 n=1 Tax=Schistosoma japonicum TaxID=6182 RepID=C7TXW0_SCHJA|nr:Putative methyltransferase NSUN5 [Schistosoma japonicum]